MNYRLGQGQFQQVSEKASRKNYVLDWSTVYSLRDPYVYTLAAWLKFNDISWIYRITSITLGFIFNTDDYMCSNDG